MCTQNAQAHLHTCELAHALSGCLRRQTHAHKSPIYRATRGGLLVKVWPMGLCLNLESLVMSLQGAMGAVGLSC